VPRLIHWLTLSAIALGVFYFWKSGLPQLSHIIMSIAMALYLLRTRFYWQRWWKWLVYFVAYCFVTNITVYILHRDLHSLYSALYYVFDALVFVHIIALAERVGTERFLKNVFAIGWVLLMFEVALVVSGRGRVFGGTRSMGTFNDPNQMANWVIIVTMCLFAIGWSLYRSWIAGAVASGVAFVLTAFSASRSGALGLMVILIVVGLIGVLRLYAMLSGKIKIRRERLLWAGAVVSLAVVFGAAGLLIEETRGVVVASVGSLADRVDYWVNRFGEASPWTTLEGRGYDRLWKFPEYLVFGAGEGANHRWSEKTWFLGEIHSTPAGLIFYYGVLGSVLFGIFVWNLVKRLGNVWFRLILLAPFVYSIGTYNLRNWFLWIGMAILYVAARHAGKPSGTNSTAEGVAPTF